MKLNELYELIKNEDQKTEQYIADKLISEINRKPSMLNHKLTFKAHNKFVFGLTILHLCVLKDMFWVVKELLNNSYVQLNALYPDEKGNNLVHYAVKYSSSEPLLQLLINKLPELIIIKNNKGHTPYHIAIIMNQTRALADLIQSNALFYHSNKKGNTLLHYAIMRESSPEVLKLIIEYFPKELINQKNYNGDTALHRAVKLNQVQAVRCLVQSRKVDMHIKNDQNLTVFDLANHDRNLKAALLHIDLEKLQESDLRVKGDRSGSISSELQDTFPLLSTPRNFSLPPLISDTPQESKSRADDQVSSGILARQVVELFELLQACSPEIDVYSKLKNKFSKFCLKMDLDCARGLMELISDTSETSSLLHSYLIEKTFSLLQQKTPDSILYTKLIKQYAILSTNFDLDDCWPLKEQLIKSSGPSEIYSDLLGELKPVLEKHFSKIQDLAQKIFLQLTFQIREQQIIDDSQPYLMPDFQEPDSKGKEKEVETKPGSLNLSQIMWLITAGQEAPGAPRNIDLQKITHIILGLQSLFSFKDILNVLKQLYPLFDHHQKLVGIYAACQLLTSNAQETSEHTKGIDRCFRSFIEGIHTQKDLFQHPGSIRKDKQSNSERLWRIRLTNLVEAYGLFQSLRDNYYLIRSCLHSHSLEAHLDSFDELVNNALAKESTGRDKEIAQIALAIMKNNMLFYQKVGICEFYNKNWSRQEHPELSPNIRTQTAHINILTDYFIEKILNQPPENITNAVKLIVQLAHALCPLEKSSSSGKPYPDLTGLLIMASVLNSASISRVTPYLKQLTTNEQAICEEMVQLCDKRFNSRWMRYIEKLPSLPFVGIAQSDITFIIDGNPEDLLNMSELLGQTLLRILKTKVHVYSGVCTHETDLPLILNKKNTNNYGSMKTDNEDEHYNKSRRIVPSTQDLVHLTLFKAPLKKDMMSFFTAFNKFLDKLERGYLTDNILPEVMIGEKKYGSHGLAQTLFLVFNEKIQSFMAPSSFGGLKKIPDETWCAINKLEHTLVKIVSIHNNYYYPDYSPTKLNSLAYLSQMTQLKESVKKLEESLKVLEERETNEAEKKRSRNNKTKMLFWSGGGHLTKLMSNASNRNSNTQDIDMDLQKNTLKRV